MSPFAGSASIANQADGHLRDRRDVEQRSQPGGVNSGATSKFGSEVIEWRSALGAA